MSKRMRVLFLGMQGQFTRIVLERLLAASVEVCGLLLSGPVLRPLLPAPSPNADPLALPLLDSFVEPHALHLAWGVGILAFESGPLSAPALADLLRTLSPDVACVACFDRIIPARLLALPHHGFLNVHPSLLPHFRGPQPLFWQLRQGVNPVGVTAHWMDAGLDTGDIAAQRTVALADGISGVEADALCAAAGGDLLAGVLAQLAAGGAQRHPQPEGGSYQPSPAEKDFSLDRGWDVRRAFNFMRGTAEWGMPYRVTSDNRTWLLSAALGWEPAETSGEGVESQGGLLRLPLAGGWLLCR
ncbi:MAG: hypothetical protein HY328_13340 [Chloroflexi bacterium]|nr:hypothetical protein [Chloroflexota bacterium]